MASRKKTGRREKGHRPPRRGPGRLKDAALAPIQAEAPASASPDAADPAPVQSAWKGTSIVGIGMSAGGFEACSDMLRALPPSPGFALVIVQHLAPSHLSALPGLLDTVSPL